MKNTVIYRNYNIVFKLYFYMKSVFWGILMFDQR